MSVPALARLSEVSVLHHGPGEPVRALDRLDLDLPPGQILAVMGPSGSGKSTLLHVLGGLIRPSSGRVELMGEDLEGLHDDALTLLRRREIGFVFQFFNLVPGLTAEENVAFPLLAGGARPRQALAEARRTLAAVGLAERARHRPRELSGGEMQRVAVARALLVRPRLLLADEPTGNLDSQAGRLLLDLFLALHAEVGATLVIATHDEQVAAIAHRRIRLCDGRVAAESAADAPA